MHARRSRFLFVFAVLLTLAAVVSASFLFGPSARPDAVKVVVFDIGQGLAVGVVTPDGHALLYDAGNSRQDVEQVIVPFFRSLGIERLDYLVLSHPDQDHVGGMPAVLDAMAVARFVDPVLPTTNRSYLETLRRVRELGIPAQRAERGSVLSLGNSVQAHILWPERPFLSESDGTVSDNENSVVLLIEHGDVRVLVPGDLERRGEAVLVQRDGERLRAHILVAGHHGSRTSSSEAFLRVVQPEVVLISVGRSNPYGHPHPEVLQRLREIGADVYRTDSDGTIVVESSGSSWTIVPRRER